MRRTGYFASELMWEWPRPEEIEHYFLAPPGERWFFETGNDGAAFENKGVDGTEHLQLGKGRIDIELMMWANEDFGVLLIWSKWVAGTRRRTRPRETSAGSANSSRARMTRRCRSDCSSRST